MRTILLINASTLVGASEFETVVAAIQQQLTEDVALYWPEAANVQLQVADAASSGQEAIVCSDTIQTAGALGDHYVNGTWVPQGEVGIKTTLDAGDAWPPTLGHEVIEQAVDPSCTDVMLAPWAGKASVLAKEPCDAVENDEYTKANGVPLTNFIFRSWYESGLPAGSHVDFMGKLSAPLTLSPGGYISYSPDLKRWHEVFGRQPKHYQLKAEVGSRRWRRLQRVQRLAA